MREREGDGGQLVGCGGKEEERDGEHSWWRTEGGNEGHWSCMEERREKRKERKREEERLSGGMRAPGW